MVELAKAKPTTLRRTSGQATALRHGEKPEKTSCTAEARRRGEEFYFDEKFAQKRENLRLVIWRHGEKTKVKENWPLISLINADWNLLQPLLQKQNSLL